RKRCVLATRATQVSTRIFKPVGSSTQEPGMESLTRLVSESLARNGFDRPLDYRRLRWSRWFRCESHHSLLFVPSKPGVFALAEEVITNYVAPVASAVPRPLTMSDAKGKGSGSSTDVESEDQ